MQTLDSEIKPYPLWLRLLFRLVGAVVAALFFGFIGKLYSDPKIMMNGVYFGIFLGLVWGEKAVFAVLGGLWYLG